MRHNAVFKQDTFVPYKCTFDKTYYIFSADIKDSGLDHSTKDIKCNGLEVLKDNKDLVKPDVSLI